MNASDLQQTRKYFLKSSSCDDDHPLTLQVNNSCVKGTCETMISPSLPLEQINCTMSFLALSETANCLLFLGLATNLECFSFHLFMQPNLFVVYDLFWFTDNSCWKPRFGSQIRFESKANLLQHSPHHHHLAALQEKEFNQFFGLFMQMICVMKYEARVNPCMFLARVTLTDLHFFSGILKKS